MMRSFSVELCALLVVGCLIAASPVAAMSEGTTTYYGLLQVPPQFFHSPMAQDTFYALQPGEVLLTQGDTVLRAPVEKDGRFVVYEIPYGTYLLQAEYYDFVFPSILVEVQSHKTAKGAEPVIHTSRNDYPVVSLRGSGTSDQSPAIIPTSGLVQYFIPRTKVDVMAIFKNPLVIMMILAFGMIGMSKLIPEEELKKSRAKNKEMNKMLLNPQEALENAFSSKKKQ